MHVHASILDEILATPTQAPRTASSQIGDLFMDANTRSNQHGTDAHYAQRASLGNGEVCEAFTKVAATESRRKTASARARFHSLREAVKFAESLKWNEGAKVASKDQKRFDEAKVAGQRLARLLLKTADQMRQDGATKLADYLDPMIVPGWAKQVRADLTCLQLLRNEMVKVPALKSAAAPDTTVADAEVKKFIRASLNQGVRPSVIAEKLEKLADLQVFDKSMASTYLQDHAGVLGLSYIEPNHYMNDCESTYKRQDTKLSAVKPQSVMQISACKGCQHFKQAAGQKHCALYRLPIVANQVELMPIINNLTAGSKDKRATLVKIANGEPARLGTPKTSSQVFARTGAKGAVLNRAKQTKVARQEAPFTEKTVLTMHNAGQDLVKIYEHGTQVAGPAQAKTAVSKFLHDLKGSQTKIALSQVDCTVLRNKLGASNAIQGAAKCASCSYRNGMHCGLTGGTLVSFPGMATAKTAHRIQAGAPKDGTAMVKEFELESPRATDIEFIQSGKDNVEFGGGMEL